MSDREGEGRVRESFRGSDVDSENKLRKGVGDMEKEGNIN